MSVFLPTQHQCSVNKMLNLNTFRVVNMLALYINNNQCFHLQAANEETKEHLYETLLVECRDTTQAVREELKSEAVRYVWAEGCPTTS